MNILILGETGVGKSTWINSFVNFVQYKSLKEAEKGVLHTLIPTSFTVCDKDLKEVTVSTGANKNEVQEAGQSATQETKIYEVHNGDKLIRIIDTPGVGDTRGIEQDKKNFQNILATLANVEELHGICILLKPNSARLTIMFRFCIKELLTYLHKDASKNIAFCFTNSRGTFYKPGDTLPSLRALLAENKGSVDIPISKSTVYCFDSEAYRFLAALKNQPPLSFQEDERENFKNSWNQSWAETKRLLDHVGTLKSHTTRSTLNLNQARTLVLQLARPLAEITRNNQTNKAILKDEKDFFNRANVGMDDLKRRQMTTRIEIEVVRIDHPKTVCANSKCVTVRSIGGGTTNTSTTEYRTVCHDHCFLNSVEADTLGDVGLMDCWAMQRDDDDDDEDEVLDNNNTCRHANCGHSYREHLHVYYDSVQKEVEVPDATVAEALKQNESVADMKKRIIAAKEREIQEYEAELKSIQQASVKFACFLKRYAITPYNDTLEQYVQHLINEEANKVGQGGSKETLESLRNSLRMYQVEKQILESGMKEGESSAVDEDFGPNVVSELVSKLKGLKHSGKLLVDALRCVEYSKKVAYEDAIVKVSKEGTLPNASSKSKKSVAKSIFSRSKVNK